MTTFSQAPSNETALQKERLLFWEIFDRLRNALLNKIFDLKPSSAAQRKQCLIILFFVASFSSSLHYYPLNLWTLHLRDVFLELLRSPLPHTYAGNAFTNFIFFVLNVFTDPHVFQYFPIFLASFFVALQTAALYLADIFELEHVSIARTFVWQVALSNSDETIRITQGDIAEQHRESLSYIIGGPAKVVVDVDSVALFERIDGTPHVIGPTAAEPGGKATIEGFERFLSAIYIRDQIVELNDQDVKSPAVMSRSRDGIQIGATDVSLIYSIYRGEDAKPTQEVPFPFSKEAVENLIYKSSSRVTPGFVYPSVYEFSWINRMVGLVRGRLSSFMNERNLTELLPHPGLSSRSDSAPMELIPHHKIASLFSQFAEDFTRRAHDNGVELHWIGVGTWKVPDIIYEKLLEGWTVSQENLMDGNEEDIRRIENEAFLQKIETLIKIVPIRAYYDILGMKGPRKKKVRGRKQELQNRKDDILLFDEEEILKTFDGKELRIHDLKKLLNEKIEASVAKRVREFTGEINHQDRINKVLIEYRKHLLAAVQLTKTKSESLNPVIEEAIRYIDSQIESDTESNVNS